MSSARVDAHQHFWRLDRGDYRWLTPELAPLYRDFGPRDLEPHLARCGIGHTVLVQAADSIAETLYLLEIARRTPWVAGVVGWIDMESPRAADDLDELARDRKLVGIRPMIQDIADERWMLRDAIAPALRALVQRDLVFDALVRPAHLPHLLELAHRHRDLRIVVDHAAKPTIRSIAQTWKGFDEWRVHMTRLARETEASVKLSGLATEAETNWTASDLRPFVEVLLEVFGHERTIWGSDWPVVELARGYDIWWSATCEFLASSSSQMREAVLGGNATRVYRLTFEDSSHGRAPPRA